MCMCVRVYMYMLGSRPNEYKDAQLKNIRFQILEIRCKLKVERVQAATSHKLGHSL